MPLLCLALISAGELLTTFVSPLAGLVVHSLLVLGLLLYSASKRAQLQQRTYLVLAMAPMIRLVSLSVPLQQFQTAYWYMLVGAPLLLAVILVAYYSGMSARQAGLNLSRLPAQLPIAALGLALGYIEYLILRPEPMVAEFTLAQIWLPALILLIFTGFLEEFIFRGVMQQAFTLLMGKVWGVLYISAVFAVLHIGYKSAADVLFVFAVAVLFGWLSLRTGSILGVTLAHGLTNITLFLVFPFLIGHPVQTVQNDQTAAQPRVSFGVFMQAVPIQALEWAAEQPVGQAFQQWFPGLLPVDEEAALMFVVDDDDDGFVYYGGERRRSADAVDGFVVWAPAETGKASALAEWWAELPCGSYDLQVYLPPGFATTRSANYQVGNGRGVTKIRVDQAIYQGQWVTLGTYAVDGSDPAWLRLTNQTGEKASSRRVAFDAVRWVQLGACGAP
jgi:membrane protease YdiL (CAAX protease family)